MRSILAQRPGGASRRPSVGCLSESQRAEEQQPSWKAASRACVIITPPTASILGVACEETEQPRKSSGSDFAPSPPALPLRGRGCWAALSRRERVGVRGRRASRSALALPAPTIGPRETDSLALRPWLASVEWGSLAGMMLRAGLRHAPAGDEMIGADFLEARFFHGAVFHRHRTAWMEAAAARRMSGLGTSPGSKMRWRRTCGRGERLPQAVEFRQRQHARPPGPACHLRAPAAGASSGPSTMARSRCWWTVSRQTAQLPQRRGGEVDGSVWFTDPVFGILVNYEGYKAGRGRCQRHIDLETGQVTVVAEGVLRPNGLCSRRTRSS